LLLMQTPTYKQELLDLLCAKIKTCARCALSKNRTQIVFGSGFPNADIMLIGEAPGVNEDASGDVFIGLAGQLLDASFGLSVLDRSDVYITNTVKCRPPQNRNPLEAEISACRQLLKLQVNIIDPKVIIAIGKIAYTTITGQTIAITKPPIVKPQFFHLFGKKRLVLPIVHPSYYCRRGLKESPQIATVLNYAQGALAHIEKKELEQEIGQFFSDSI